MLPFIFLRGDSTVARSDKRSLKGRPEPCRPLHKIDGPGTKHKQHLSAPHEARHPALILT